MKKSLAMLILSVLLLAACAPAPAQPQPPTQDVGLIVQQTLAAMTTQAVAPTSTSVPPTPVPPTQAPAPTPEPATGSIGGSLNSPASALPAMRVVAFSTTSSAYYSVDTQLGQNWYQIDGLPAGGYIVIAYSLGGNGVPVGKAGGYTEAMHSSNNNHQQMQAVNVVAGQITQNINPGDWSAQASGMYPPMPDAAPATVTGGPQPLTEGAIAGPLTFPSEGLPAMTVFAFNTVGFPNGDNRFVFTQPGQNSYEISLPQGDYYIVAYALDEHGVPTGIIGGYTVCGDATPDCSKHTLLPVSAAPGGATTGIGPSDWYAPEGAYPPYPLLP
jgi:hypothetical protein